MLQCENQHTDLKVESRNYNGIDVVKFLCSISVFFIHVPFLTPPMGGELSAFEQQINFVLQHYVGRIAVPFFFVSSGFLLYKKMSPDNLNIERIKNYCFKILRLFGIWSILLFASEVGHLWYLMATVVAIAFISCCFNFHIKYRYVFLIACLLYVFGLLGDSYFGLIEPIMENSFIVGPLQVIWDIVIDTSRNGLFMGTIFVLIGILFSQGKIKIRKSLSLLGFIVSMICLIGEIFVLQYFDILANNNMYICLVPAAFFLFSFAYTIHLKDRPIYASLRTIGVLVYFLHIFVNMFFDRLLIEWLNKLFHADLKPFQSLISLVVTLLIAVCIERLSHKERFKWMNLFFS